jgi:IrrE N-terminal-like domain
MVPPCSGCRDNVRSRSSAPTTTTSSGAPRAGRCSYAASTTIGRSTCAQTSPTRSILTWSRVAPPTSTKSARRSSPPSASAPPFGDPPAAACAASSTATGDAPASSAPAPPTTLPAQRRRIRVSSTTAPAQRAKTLAHELAHALLHADAGDDRALEELEAESVARVVCDPLGIRADDWTFGYVAGWAGGGEPAIAAIKAAGAAPHGRPSRETYRRRRTVSAVRNGRPVTGGMGVTWHPLSGVGCSHQALPPAQLRRGGTDGRRPGRAAVPAWCYPLAALTSSPTEHTFYRVDGCAPTGGTNTGRDRLEPTRAARLDRVLDRGCGAMGEPVPLHCHSHFSLLHCRSDRAGHRVIVDALLSSRLTVHA